MMGTTPLPWQAKVAAKLALARLPVRYDVWARWSLFKHGRMEEPNYALGVVREHARNAGLTSLQGLVGLELGPGDTVASALIGHALGAARWHLVDVAPDASRDIDAYRPLLERLRDEDLALDGVAGASTVDELLTRSNAVYATEGLDSLRALPDESVDFAFSHAVLEHVRLAEFEATLTELHRVLRPGRASSHTVDLRDHLDGRLNNLRFSDRFWEAEWVAASGFYTNRIRYGEMCAMFARLGFEIDVVAQNHWPSVPVDRSRLRPRWRDLPDDDLRVSGFTAVLTKPA